MWAERILPLGLIGKLALSLKAIFGMFYEASMETETKEEVLLSI